MNLQKERSKHCIITSACVKYVPELTALLNSLEIVGNKNDVFILGYQLPTELTDQFTELSYNVIYYDIPEKEAREFGGEGEILCRKRFWYAAEWGSKYKGSTLILDADMVVVRDLNKFFRIAHKTGLILGATLEQKRMYGNIEHHKVKGAQLLPQPIWNYADICCAPIFVDMKIYDDIFKKSWDIFADGYPENNFKAPDMESYNLLLLASQMEDMVHLLPNFQFVGSNEKLLKPYLRAIKQEKDPHPGGKIWSEIGDPIYIIHGGFYNQVWRNQQILNRIQCINGYIGGSEKCENMARGSLELLYRYFKQCLDNGPIQIDSTIAYRNNGDPGETVVTV